eukprot:Nk52_evm38s270 gene=Nk52_evmTU38s270
MKPEEKSERKQSKDARLDRHSGSGMRGLPKKGGAGGKGTWGKEGEEYDDSVLDENDPNYVPEEKAQ